MNNHSAHEALVDALLATRRNEEDRRHTDDHVPSEDEMRRAYRLSRMLDHHAAVDAAFDRFIARVRRDAYDWGRHDESMSLAYAPPESGRPTGHTETED